jgi:serine/threonine protein kinase
LRPRTVQQTLTVLSPIAAALACAHARGVVHRDVKPGNIVLLRGTLDGETRCKLVDFGIATVARECESAVSGLVERAFTPCYGAPEQFDPSYGSTGPWTDIYALALVAVEMMCGREPLEGADVAALRRCSCDPQRRPSPRALGVEVGEDVELVLRRALALLPGDRFQDMRVFWAELSRAAARRSAVSARPPIHPMDATTPFDLRRMREVPVRRRARRRSGRAGVLIAVIGLPLALSADSRPPAGVAEVEGGATPSASGGATRHVAQVAQGARVGSQASSATFTPLNEPSLELHRPPASASIGPRTK